MVYVSNNLELINTERTKLHYKSPYPNDITKWVHLINKTDQINTSNTSWVKGHQDK